MSDNKRFTFLLFNVFGHSFKPKVSFFHLYWCIIWRSFNVPSKHRFESSRKFSCSSKRNHFTHRLLVCLKRAHNWLLYISVKCALTSILCVLRRKPTKSSQYRELRFWRRACVISRKSELNSKNGQEPSRQEETKGFCAHVDQRSAVSVELDHFGVDYHSHDPEFSCAYDENSFSLDKRVTRTLSQGDSQQTAKGAMVPPEVWESWRHKPLL